MRIPFCKLLFFPFILSGGFLFNYPVNANPNCNWDTASFQSIGSDRLSERFRYCVMTDDNIYILMQGSGDPGKQPGGLNRLGPYWHWMDLAKWQIEDNGKVNLLVKYTCPAEYESWVCSGEFKREVVAYQIR